MVSSFKLKNSNRSVGLRNETRKYKNKQAYGFENNISYKEVAATNNKAKILLSDNEFGKY